MKTPNRTAFGSKTEELLGERSGDRALRFSDLDLILPELVLKVVKKAGYVDDIPGIADGSIDFAKLMAAAVRLSTEGLASLSDTELATTAWVDAFLNSVPRVRACANFNAVPLSGTYSRSGATVTVTMTAHGMSTGQRVLLDFTSGTATDGTYFVTVTGADTFTVTDTASGTTSGNVTRNIWIRSAFNVASIADNGVGDFTIMFATAMPDAAYFLSALASGNTNHPQIAASIAQGVAPTTGQVRIRTGPSGGANSFGFAADPEFVHVVIFQ